LNQVWGIVLKAKGSRIFTVLLGFLLIFLIFSTDPLSGSDPFEMTFTLKGRVRHNITEEGLENYTVVVDRDFFISRETRTDVNGSYNFVVPPGNYTLFVYTPTGILVGQLEIFVSREMSNHYDFEIDPKNPRRSRFSGRIVDDLENGVEKTYITLTQSDPFWTNTTMTDDEGYFSLYVPSGHYLLTVTYDDKERINRSIDLGWGEEKDLELEIDLSGERPILTKEDITNFFNDHWQNILVLLGVLILILVIYTLFLWSLNFLKSRKYKWLESEWFVSLRRFVGRISILGVILIIGRQVARISPAVDEYVWSWMPELGASIAGILLVLLILRILLNADQSFWDYIKEKKGEKGDAILPHQIISMLEIITRYVIILISVMAVILLILSAFGLSESIFNRAGGFLSDNAGKLLFLLALVAVGILSKRFLDIFFNEFANRTTKLSPQVMEMSRKGTMGMVYFIIGLIFMFTLLSIGGLGDIGQTFILVISMIVGLVVSFAATGSIGNMLSGLVLVSIRPFNVGDRVEVTGGMIGYVENMGVMFTRIRDLEGRVNEIPNNNILSTQITNYTQSAKDGYAVVVDVTLGYEIHPKKVRSLMKRAALTSPGVLKDPTPKVLVRSFHNHAVEYRLRAYVNDPQNMLFIRSSVMESMLIIFHEEGLEILSPLYHVKRDGVNPTCDELSERSRPPSDNNREDVSGLSMFDSLEQDS
jgi:small-conductance mechanosensitive channel